MIREMLCGAILLLGASSASAQLFWSGYGGNPQHSAIYTGASQTISKIHWQVPMDTDPQYYNGVVFAHFASPMVSPSNTVVYGVRSNSTVNGQTSYDNWSMVGVNGSTGQRLFYFHSDYSAPVVWPADWTSILPMTLAKNVVAVSATSTGRKSKASISHPSLPSTTSAVVAGVGGSIFVRTSADAYDSPIDRRVFYTNLQDFNTNVATYSAIKIVTPLTSDNNGNVYFGYEVNGPVPSSLNLGSGGVAKVNVVTGASAYQSVQNMAINGSIQRPAFNAAPAVSNDGTEVYVALTGSEGGFLARLSTFNLATTASVQLMDPTSPGSGALLIDESSAAPMVAPDGHVFMGTFRVNWGESHGILLQFDGNLNPADANGHTFLPGAFGWDDTPSIVPSSMIPSYKGSSSYLLLCKYNNYDDNGGDPQADGSNMVAVLDPASPSVTTDRQSGIPVMNVVISVLGPTKTNDDPNHPNARREWCINSAAIDVAKKGAIINSEDGWCYRWNFVTNTLTEKMDLQPPTGEAYTSTVIGPDGTIYAMNNTILFALGN